MAHSKWSQKVEFRNIALGKPAASTAMFDTLPDWIEYLKNAPLETVTEYLLSESLSGGKTILDLCKKNAVENYRQIAEALPLDPKLFTLRTPEGQTQFMLAALQWKPDLLEAVSSAAEGNLTMEELFRQKDYSGQNAFMYACEYGTTETLDWMFTKLQDKPELLKEMLSARRYDGKNVADFAAPEVKPLLAEAWRSLEPEKPAPMPEKAVQQVKTAQDEITWRKVITNIMTKPVVEAVCNFMKLTQAVVCHKADVRNLSNHASNLLKTMQEIIAPQQDLGMA